jgi:hypothetical protein
MPVPQYTLPRMLGSKISRGVLGSINKPDGAETVLAD